MSGVTIGFLMGGLVLVLLVIRVHIAVAMLLAGGIGYALVAGIDPLFNYAKTMAFARYSVYDLSVVPLFLLMGNLASRGGLSRRLFQATNAFLGHYRGGVAMSAVGACAGFGAICGSSLATAATMGQVALPELRRYNYSPALATGALAAGGTLGVLIPPSVVLVIYAVLAEQNVAAMFIAALLPGLLALSGYMVAIMHLCAPLARQRPGCATHELERAPAHPARGLADCGDFCHRDRRHLRRHLHPH